MADQPARSERSVRSKQLDQRNIYGAKLGIRDGKILFPAGAIVGQHLELFLGTLAGAAVNLRSFDELPIPYRAIATDVADGSMVVLDHGNLAAAMRASMSVPAVFVPQRIEGRRLVDGGLVRNLRAYREGLGADLDYDKANIEANYAFGFDRHSVIIGGRYGTRLGTQLPTYDAFSLGGPLNLSGFQDNQLLGTGVRLGRILYHYRIATGGRFVSAYYAGGSLEAGNVTDRFNGPALPGLIWGSALFVAADTLLGPLYLALGYAEGGNYAVYLFLGRR